MVAIVGAVVIAQWVRSSPSRELRPRLPFEDGSQQTGALSIPPVNLEGSFVSGPGKPSDLTASWPRFRGAGFDAISRESVPLVRQFAASGPIRLWSVELGEGYAGPVVANGSVYLLDYDIDKRADVIRCLSMEDGREVWRRSYEIEVTRNHGISRTTPAVTDRFLVTLGPKCQVVCVDAISGSYRWGIDLAREYGTTVPPWYAGQCPLIDNDRAIIAPGGDALMIAVDCASGQVLWKTPNPNKWEMTHSSIVPMEFAGRRMYVYCGSGGVVGVSAEDGSILWQTTHWKVAMANVPTPVIAGKDRILLTGGYGAGAAMLQLAQLEGQISPKLLWRVKPEVFGSEQQTPIYHNGYIYGVIPGGQLVCLDLDGKQVWASGAKHRFGLGPYMLADGMILLVSDNGVLSLVLASETRFELIAEASVFDHGHEAWGPLALVDGRLLVRDLTRMACLDIRKAGHD